MRLFQHLLFAFALCGFGFTAAAGASPADPKSGVEYKTLAQPQHTDAAPGKIEVLEFFSYTCPHCYSFEPVLVAWLKKNADKVSFRRVHVSHHAIDMALQRAYVTFEAMGVAEQVHPKLFAAFHVDKERLGNDAAIVEWLPKAGIARDKYVGMANSFGLQGRITRARKLNQAYNIQEWPMIAIGGRYLTSPYMAGGAPELNLDEPQQQIAALQVMDHLLAKARAENK